MASSILVVDDDPVMGALVEDGLQSWGYEVAVAEDAESALLLLAQRPFEAVISDINMPGPGGDGFALLAQIIARSPDMPVVLMSAYPTPETTQRAIESGAATFLAKPFRLSLLREFLDRSLAPPRVRQR